jgi:hypothetical protein
MNKDGKLWAATRLGLAIFNEQLDVFNTTSKKRTHAGKWILSYEFTGQTRIINLNNNNVA